MVVRNIVKKYIEKYYIFILNRKFASNQILKQIIKTEASFIVTKFHIMSLDFTQI